MSRIDYGQISWEQFEDLCNSLWFEEGYTNIKPMGYRHEGGRDAVFYDAASNTLIIFQYKRWTTRYSSASLRANIKQAAQKIAHYTPSKFILNSAHEPDAAINDWIDQLAVELGFPIEYYDRSWVDLRLDNTRQDLRKVYFGIDLNHHSWTSLVYVANQQLSRTISTYSEKYSDAIYVTRKVETHLLEFIESKAHAIAIVDRSGRGKTNLLCNFAKQLTNHGKMAILVRGNSTLVDDNGLERLVIQSLGYNEVNYQVHFNEIERLLTEYSSCCHIFIDGLSESPDLGKANRALINLLSRFPGSSCFKLILSCRDTNWSQLGYGLQDSLFYLPFISSELDSGPKQYGFNIGDFSPEEIEAALPLYKKQFNIQFRLSSDARRQLSHPLLLRFFCEAYKNQQLRTVDNVPILGTYDNYLDTKINSICYRSGWKFAKGNILKFLQELAKATSEDQKNIKLSEESWNSIVKELSISEREELTNLLAEEALVEIDQEPVLGERQISILFDNLREFLLLRQLLNELPADIRSATDLLGIGLAVMKQMSDDSNFLYQHKLLSLIGMLIPDLSSRRDFLDLLCEWDFHTFCSCLATLPTVLKEDFCYEGLELFAQTLAYWYRTICNKIFTIENRSLIEPWIYKNDQESLIGIELHASPNCRELSYGYTCCLVDDGQRTSNIQVIRTDSFPTWRVSINTIDTKFELHDPEKGAMVSLFRVGRGPFDEIYVRRTTNLDITQRFPGESISVPERMALFDIYCEIDHLLKNMETILPYVPLAFVKNPYEIVTTNISEIDSSTLEEYLKTLMVSSVQSYNWIVGEYFNYFGDVLNLSAQMPCSIVAITDREQIRYAFLPVQKHNETKISTKVVEGNLNIMRLETQFMVNVLDDSSSSTVPLNEITPMLLDLYGRLRPPIHVIDLVEPITEFWGQNAVKNTVRRWLLADFKALMKI